MEVYAMIKDLWEAMTFQTHYYGPLSACDIIEGILLWIVMLAILLVIGAVVAWLTYTVYRVIAYDYEEVTFRAKVTGKKFKRWHYMLNGSVMVYYPNEYNVHIATIEYGLGDVINDKELFNWDQKGARLKVTMKIGWSRSEKPEIKYWRVTKYSWRR